jgi:hypothetical protein
MAAPFDLQTRILRNAFQGASGGSLLFSRKYS